MMEQGARLMDVLIEQKIIVYRVAKDEEKKNTRIYWSLESKSSKHRRFVITCDTFGLKAELHTVSYDSQLPLKLAIPLQMAD